MVKLPLFLMLFVSKFMMVLNKVVGIKPLITPALVHKFNFQWNVSPAKAERELGYRPLSFKEGAGRTLEWIREQDKSEEDVSSEI